MFGLRANVQRFRRSGFNEELKFVFSTFTQKSDMFNTRFKDVINFLFVFLSIYLSLIYLLVYFETEDPSLNSNLDTFWEGVWYSIVTISSVGYGDYVPSSGNGKIIGFIFVLSSIGLYGYIVSKLTNYIAIINENKKMGFNGTNFQKHTVIVGWDSYSKSVAEQLVEVGYQIAIVTRHKEDIDLIYEHFTKDEKQIFVLFTEFDNYDTLKKANIHKAATVFINTGDDSQKLVHTLNMKREFPDTKFIVTLDNTDLKDTFKTAGVTYPLSKYELSSKLLASYIFEPDVATLGEELLSVAKSDNDYDIKEYLVIDSNPLVGVDYNSAFFDMKKQFNTVLLGISKIINGKRELIKNPEENVIISKGDYLILICNGKQETPVTEYFGVEEGFKHT